MARTIWLALLSLLCVAWGTASAQEALTEVVTVKVRPGMNPQLEEFMRALVEAARQEGSGNYWRVAQSATGAPTYTINVSMSGWVDMANPGPQLEDAFGKEEAARLGGLAASAAESVDTAFYVPRLDLSSPPPQGSGVPDALTFSDISLNPGMLQQYVESARKTREASMAVLPDAHFLVFTPDLGADVVRVVGFIRSWEELDEPFVNPGQRVIQHFGEQEGGRIAAQATGAISGFDVSLQRPRPDLSYQPED